MLPLPIRLTVGPLGSDGLPFESTGIPPEPFQSVELALLILEDVNDEVSVIEQHPLRFGPSLVAKRPATPILELLDHVVGKALHMGTRRSGGNDEHLGYCEEIADVEQDYIEALLVSQGIGCRPGYRVGVVDVFLQIRSVQSQTITVLPPSGYRDLAGRCSPTRPREGGISGSGRAGHDPGFRFR